MMTYFVSPGWMVFVLVWLDQDPTLEDILSEQTGEFAEEGDSVAACGKAISRSKKAVSVPHYSLWPTI